MCLTYDGGIICDCEHCERKYCWQNKDRKFELESEVND